MHELVHSNDTSWPLQIVGVQVIDIPLNCHHEAMTFITYTLSCCAVLATSTASLLSQQC